MKDIKNGNNLIRRNEWGRSILWFKFDIKVTKLGVTGGL
jgi:hypothetical protein